MFFCIFTILTEIKFFFGNIAISSELKTKDCFFLLMNLIALSRLHTWTNDGCCFIEKDVQPVLLRGFGLKMFILCGFFFLFISLLLFIVERKTVMLKGVIDKTIHKSVLKDKDGGSMTATKMVQGRWFTHIV